jgi:hypothetical protein
MPESIPGCVRHLTGGLVQHGHEGFPGFGKDVRQAASFGNPAGAAVDQPVVPFSMSNNLTNGDFGNRSRQGQSNVTSLGGLDEASISLWD